MDRRAEAFDAARRILETLEEAGLNYTNPGQLYDDNRNCMPAGLQIACGVTRLVIWDEYCDYVIKIAFTDLYEKYNKHEVEVYAAAVEEGLEENFAWCDCYIQPCESDDFWSAGVYVMEYLDGNSEEVSDRAWDYEYKQYCEEHDYDSSSYDYADDFNDWYYDDEDQSLMNFFLSQVENKVACKIGKFISKFNINDLHCGNFLFRGDRLVICDYAGYGW